MDPTRFDSIARLFASRTSRRAALATSAGLVSASIGRRVFAQSTSATPPVIAAPPGTPPRSASFLFVQPFESGTWAPKTGEDGVYTLTLTGALAQTIYFSDRPERIFGHMPTPEFLDELGFTPDNPPNAALVADTGNGTQEVLIVELLNPVYDAGASALTYDAVVLADYSDHALTHAARQQATDTYPETFGAGGLYIDSLDDFFGIQTCEPVSISCYWGGHDGRIESMTFVGDLETDSCLDQSDGTCSICNPDLTGPDYGFACAVFFPEDCYYRSEDEYNCSVLVNY